jgi:hypothetical protein
MANADWLSHGRSRKALRHKTAYHRSERGIVMHFRIYDLAADRCVWSIPLIDTVPIKLRAQRLVVRVIDNDGGVFEVVPIEGVRLADLATQFLADHRVNRLNVKLQADDSYAGRVVRHDNQ